MAEDAIRTANDREERRRSGIPEPVEPITYAELAARYLNGLDVVRQDWAEGMVAHSTRTFGGTRVDQITQEQVRQWLAALPLGASAKGQALTKLRAIFEDGVDLGYLARNPARGRVVRAPKVPRSEIRPFASWEEVEKVAAHAGRDASIIKWACSTGMRPEEWAALRWIDVDLRAKTCRISQVIVEGAIKSTGKTDGALRTVVLADVAFDVLTAMPRPLDSREFVFTAPAGGPVRLRNFRSRVWYPSLVSASVEATAVPMSAHIRDARTCSRGRSCIGSAASSEHADISTTLRHYARFLTESGRAEHRPTQRSLPGGSDCVENRVNN